MEKKFEADFGDTIEIPEETKNKLLKKSEKSTCKIMTLSDDGMPLNGTAFFAKFKNLNKIFLFTNNHILNENKIKPESRIKSNYMGKIKQFELKNRLCFTNIQLDYTCIEIKEEDKIEDFFEIEDQEKKRNDEYDAEDVALAQYPKGGILKIIAGHLINIEAQYIKHLVSTFKGSSGSPIILLLRDFKVLGIHSQFCEQKNINLGINMKNIFEDIIKKLSEKIDIEEIKEEVEKEIKYDGIKYQSLLSKCYSKNDNIIGIDFGIMNSCVGIIRNKKVEIINDIKCGGNIIPSIVCYKKNNILIGKSARDNMTQNSESIMFNSNRLIGLKFNDPQIQNYIKKWPMKIIEDSKTKKPQYVIKVENKEQKFFPEEVCSKILQYLKKNAEIYNNTKINKAVITVPIQFNNEQRRNIIKAAELAGLEIIKIISEPIACVIAYNQFIRCNKEKKILIFYFGEGTLDISIIKIEENEYSILASCGEDNFGQEDFNNKLEEYIIKEINKKNEFKNINFNNKNDKRIIRILNNIKRRVEQITIELNCLNNSIFYIDSLYDNKNFKLNIERKKYEELCNDLWKKSLDKIDEALKFANLKKEEIDEIILAGNSIRTPKINEMITKYFNGKKPLNNINCEEVIAYGATLSPYINIKMNEILKEAIGIEVSNGKMNTIIPSGTIIPYRDYNNQVYSKVFHLKNEYAKIKFKIYMGNNEEVSQNKFLGEFEVIKNEFKEKKIIIYMSLNYKSFINVIAELDDIKQLEINIPLNLK